MEAIQQKLAVLDKKSETLMQEVFKNLILLTWKG